MKRTSLRKPLRRLTRSSYRKRLTDPRWQKKRLEVFHRDNWTCRACGATDQELQVHHTRYVGDQPWEAPLSALVTLCVDCHRTQQRR